MNYIKLYKKIFHILFRKEFKLFKLISTNLIKFNYSIIDIKNYMNIC